MRAVQLLTWISVPVVLAINIDTPTDVKKQSTLEMTWSEDTESAVFYITNNFKDLQPIAIATLENGRSTAAIPNVDYDSGYIVAYTPNGEGPIGTTKKFTLTANTD